MPPGCGGRRLKVAGPSRPRRAGPTARPARRTALRRRWRYPRTQCRRRLPSTRRIEEATATWLIEKFPGDSPAVTSRPDGVAVSADDVELVLTRAHAAELRDALADALTHTREFLHTVGEHRADGSYVVARRNADSAGHRKVFDSLDELRRLYHRLPDEFTADDVGRTGLTGGRRHMLLRHLAEHPGFDCELVSRQPLTVRKLGDGERETDLNRANS